MYRCALSSTLCTTDSLYWRLTEPFGLHSHVLIVHFCGQLWAYPRLARVSIAHFFFCCNVFSLFSSQFSFSTLVIIIMVYVCTSHFQKTILPIGIARTHVHTHQHYNPYQNVEVRGGGRVRGFSYARMDYR